jgi:hypothetical protein
MRKLLPGRHGLLLYGKPGLDQLLCEPTADTQGGAGVRFHLDARSFFWGYLGGIFAVGLAQTANWAVCRFVLEIAVRRGGVLFFNPGSAGPRRFRLPVSMGTLRLGGGRLVARLRRL